MIGFLAALLVLRLLFAASEIQDTNKMYTSGSDALYNCSSVEEICKVPIPSSYNNCSRAGVWKNELQSVMRITCIQGQIRGFYCSAVGKAKSYYPLSGRYLVARGNSVIMGWTVAWQNPSGNNQSSTSWSAISYTGDVIESQWLLTSYSTELWRTVMSNRDRFMKVRC
ncbi:streptavidin-like [Dreissena polymorpha]|uniref:Uncharacterized protein n=1 Tax=Dreissena polymorpha TaxID=45954 RepID=A0A9D4MTE7_DREPO|nr:streptavidin-like [Dreissena polymorpha]KAH3881584.1 hypothetical protein DPMN_005510 [Dreissena polymorpha]